MAERLTRDQFERVAALFARATSDGGDLEGGLAFVRAEAADDPAVRAELERMLAFHAQDDPTTGDGFDDKAAAAVRSETADMGDTLFEAVPERIGPFQIVRHVATGGMGVVYEALQRSPFRRVALKVIRTGFRTPRAVRRFEKEGDILATLDHPGIARIHAMGRAELSTGEAPYIAMEYVDGPMILEYARQVDPDTRTRLALLASVCDAVQYAHDAGVIHRDLKPSNILVDVDGAPKIVDFGIARTFGGKHAHQSSISLAGQVLGTLAYMSPEQMRAGAVPVDTGTDIYSLAAVGYALLAGVPPHDLRGATVPEAYAAVTGAAPPPLSSALPGLGAELDAAFAQALAPERADRHASVGAFAADIRTCLRMLEG